MKTYLLNKLYTILLFIVSALAMEAFLFIYLGFGFFPEYVLFDIGLILFVSFVVLFLPCGKTQNIILGIFLFLQAVLSYINVCIYTALGDVFTFEMLSLVDETTRVLTTSMFPVWPLIFYVGLYAMDIVGLVVIRKKLNPKGITYRNAVRFIVKDIALFGLTLSFALYALATTMLKGNEKDDLFLISDKVLYGSFSSNKQSLIKFGTWGFYFEQFFRRIYTVDSVVSYTKSELSAFSKFNEYDQKNQKLYGVNKGSNLVVLMLESFEWYAINEEMTPTLYALAQGYDFGVRDSVTGLYSNFNYYDFSKDASGRTILTRRDYDYEDGKYSKKVGSQILNHDLFGAYGLTMTNYYSKSKTDYSEMSMILGNYPYSKSFTTHGGLFGYSSKNLYSDVDYCFSLPNRLKNSGAVETANYMHAYLSKFYGRNTLMPQFGFDNTLFLDQMSNDIEQGDSLSHIVRDSEVLDYYLNMSDEYDFMPTDEKFFSFYTTVTTHGEYSYNPLLESNYEFIKALPYLGNQESGENTIDLDEQTASMVESYFASVLDTEYAVTILVKYLMENNLFDNTVLCLFSDHQCYYDGMDINYKQYYFTDDEDGYSSPMDWLRDKEYGEQFNANNQDRYLVPAMIYSTKIDDSVVGEDVKSHFIDKFTCSFDLTVSLMNLMGVEYTTGYYMGYPVICEVVDISTNKVEQLGVPAYISCTGGIFNDRISTEDGNTLKFIKNDVVLPRDLRTFSYNVSKYIERWYKVTALYDYNMFK